MTVTGQMFRVIDQPNKSMNVSSRWKVLVQVRILHRFWRLCTLHLDLVTSGVERKPLAN